MILKKAVQAVTRKSRYYDTEARTGIAKTDCTKPRETQTMSNLFLLSRGANYWKTVEKPEKPTLNYYENGSSVTRSGPI